MSNFAVSISFQRFVALPKFSKSSVLLGTMSCSKSTLLKLIVSLSSLPNVKFPPTVKFPGIVIFPVTSTLPT